MNVQQCDAQKQEFMPSHFEVIKIPIIFNPYLLPNSKYKHEDYSKYYLLDSEQCKIKHSQKVIPVLLSSKLALRQCYGLEQLLCSS